MPRKYIYTVDGRKKQVASKLGNKNPAKRKDVREKISNSKKGYWKGEKNPMYGVRRVGKNNPFYGRKHTEMTKRKMGESKKELYINGYQQSEEHRKKNSEANGGKKHWNWQGGINNLPYAFEFTSKLKLFIRQRDAFICQFCGIVENGRAHICHHIDYDKMNYDEKNLILLCSVCNSKANFSRNKWTFLFQILQEIRILEA